MKRATAMSMAAVITSGAVLLGPVTGPASADAPTGVARAERAPSVRIPTNDEIVTRLAQLERRSRGRVDVFTLTQRLPRNAKTKSEDGRDLYVAKVGTGPTRVWVSANIHGNEQLPSESVLQLIAYLGTSNSRTAATIRRTLTVYFIPTMNPDGRAMNLRWTVQRDDKTQAVIWGEDSKPKVVDLNRDWFPGMAADESHAWYAFFSSMKPHDLLDLHQTAARRVPGTKHLMSTMSLGVALSPDRATLPKRFSTPVRQLAGHVYNTLTRAGYRTVDRYQLLDFPKPGSFGELDYRGGLSSAVMLGKSFMHINHLNDADWACPAMFLEAAGEDLRPRTRRDVAYLQSLNRQTSTATMAYLTGIATGAAWKVDPKTWNRIPAEKIWGYYTDAGPVPVG